MSKNRQYVEFDTRTVELAPREAWLKSRIGTDVLFQDWEMYSWGDFRHHCSTETPDEINETRPNVTGTIFNTKRLACKDCRAVMPKGVMEYFQATFKICTMKSNPPMEFYLQTNAFHPGGFIAHSPSVRVNPLPQNSFYLCIV